MFFGRISIWKVKIFDKKDEGISKEFLLDFYMSLRKTKTNQIIIFNDSVSESQLNQVLSIKLDQITEAYKVGFLSNDL